MSASSFVTGAAGLPAGLGSAVQVYRDHTRILYTGLERYFDQPTFSDVTVVAPSGRKLKCHQLVLSACSRRFAVILEQGDFTGQDLPVQGVDSDALELILRFFYTGDCPIMVTSAMPLYDASTKLEVPGLSTACEQFINQLVHPITASIFLEQALQLKLEAMADMLLQFVRGRFEDVTLSDTFPAVSYSTMLKVLLDNKPRQTEASMFKAASKWILADNKRVELADDVFKALNISSATVQSLLQQNTLHFLQPGGGGSSAGGAPGSDPRSSDMGAGSSGAGNGLSSSLLAAAAGAPAGLSMSPLSSLPQLQLPAGMMSLPALALQLQQQGLSPVSLMPNQDSSPQPGSATTQASLLSLLNSRLPMDGTGIAKFELQNLLAAAATSGATPDEKRLSLGLGSSSPTDNGLSMLHASLQKLGSTPTGLNSLAGAASAGNGNGITSNGKAGQRQQQQQQQQQRGNGKRAFEKDSGSPAANTRRAKKGADSGGSSRMPSNGHGSAFDQSPSLGANLQQPATTTSSKQLMSTALQLYSQPSTAEGEEVAHIPQQLPVPPSLKGVCHVDNCYADLTQLRDYHQRFKICDYHLKVSSIMKDGVPQRFCQQCGRFHLLSEFDGNKRSCRARLQRHNARRRKKAEADGVVQRQSISVIREIPGGPGASLPSSPMATPSLSVNTLQSLAGQLLPMPLGGMRDLQAGQQVAALAARAGARTGFQGDTLLDGGLSLLSSGLRGKAGLAGHLLGSRVADQTDDDGSNEAFEHGVNASGNNMVMNGKSNHLLGQASQALAGLMQGRLGVDEEGVGQLDLQAAQQLQAQYALQLLLQHQQNSVPFLPLALGGEAGLHQGSESGFGGGEGIHGMVGNGAFADGGSGAGHGGSAAAVGMQSEGAAAGAGGGDANGGSSYAGSDQGDASPSGAEQHQQQNAAMADIKPEIAEAEAEALATAQQQQQGNAMTGTAQQSGDAAAADGSATVGDDAATGSQSTQSDVTGGGEEADG